MTSTYHSLYQQAVSGELPKPSKQRARELREQVANFDILVKSGLSRLRRYCMFRYRGEPHMTLKERGFHSLNAYVERNLKLRKHIQEGERQRLEVAVMVYVHDLALTNTRYWGVTNPKKEHFCSKCDRVLPVSKFTESDFSCDDCLRGDRIYSQHYREHGAKRRQRKCPR